MLKKRDLGLLAALRDEHVRRKAKRSFRTFVELLWPVLEPGTPFLPNWHIDLISEYLEQVSAGKVRRLVINLPPRYGKSLLISVLWPCWEWLQAPSRRWLFASYSESLATRHAVDRRRLLTSEEYGRRWGQEVRLVGDQQTKLETHNTARGMMTATSIGGTVLGKGGNRLVVDDPHSPAQAASEVQRSHAIEFFTQTLSTRLDDKQRDAIVVVMQRLHPEDLSGVSFNLGYTHLSLPAIEPDPRRIVFPRSGRVEHRSADDVLWPARENRALLEDQRRALGTFGFSAQYLQQPIPPAGGRFRREWWRYDERPVFGGQIIQSWDLTFKAGDSTDYVVGLVAMRKGSMVHILDRYKKRATFTETCAAILEMKEKYPDTRAVLVEDAANGAAVINTLRQKVPGLIPVRPEGSKELRADAILPQVEAGQVHLPAITDAGGRLMPNHEWVEDFVGACAAFPHGKHDDDVDALSQLLRYCQRQAAPRGLEPWMLGPPIEGLKNLRLPEKPINFDTKW